jgi:uncharacterized membrane protein
MKIKTKFLVQAGIIAAVYVVVLTILTLIFPFGFINFGIIQMRASEALTVLPYFTPAAIPGLFIGCLISNVIGVATGAAGAIDIVVGSVATLLAAIASYKLRSNKWLVPLPPVLINAVFVGLELYYFTPAIPWWNYVLLVGAGQTIACYILGMPLLFLLDKRRKIFQ